MAGAPTRDSTNDQPIAIGARGRGDDQDFFRLTIREPGARPRPAILSVSDFRSDRHGVIAALRLPLVSRAAISRFETAIQQALEKKKSTFRVATSPGWHGTCFVLPDGYVQGRHEFEVCLPLEWRRYFAKFKEHGDLRRWREIAELATGNSRLILAISLACVGPIGGLTNVEMAMIQIFGESGRGKSAVAGVAGSFWGCEPDAVNAKFSETWHHTVNDLERVAAPHHSTFLVLDETKNADRGKQGRSHTIVDAVMRIHEGVDKGRLPQSAPPQRWWMGVLSTSNQSMDQLAELEGRRGAAVDEAHRTRMIDVPMDDPSFFAFEDLHGYDGHGDFASRLLELARANHGVASIEFIARLVRWRERDDRELRAWIRERRRRYRDRARQTFKRGGRDLTRVHEKFATIYAAGALLVEFEIVGWTRSELCDAILKCERAHVDFVGTLQRGAEDRDAAEDPLTLLRAYIKKNRGRFVDLTQSLCDRRHDHQTCPGYLNASASGEKEILLRDQTLREVCGSKAAANRLKRDLIAKSVLLGDEHRPSTRRMIWRDGGREQVLALLASAFIRSRSRS